MLIPAQTPAQPVRNPRQEKRLWNYGDRYSLSLGCTSCPDRAVCGGLQVESAPFDCLGFCCGNPQNCDAVCRMKPEEFAQRVREISGFSLDNVPRARVLQAPDLPALVPTIFHGDKRHGTFRASPVACLPLYKVICRHDGQTRYTSTQASRRRFGHRSVFHRASTRARGQFSGEAVPVPRAEAVSTLGAADFSVSNQGTLVFGRGRYRYQLTWFNREGKVLSTVGQPDRYVSIRISPDGKGVAASREDAAGLPDAWRIDFAGGAPNRLTFDGNGYRTAWSPDGRRIFYSSAGAMFETEANGAGQGEAVRPTQHLAWSNDWSPDGRYWMYTETSPETQGDLWIVPTGGDRKPVPYLKTPFNEVDGQFSPDGKWVAYTSDESGRNEVYVRGFPVSAAKFPVSSGGGGLPRWRQDGRELFYRTVEGRLMVASVRPVAQGLEFGTPVALFPTVLLPTGRFNYPYDVSPDGQRILALAPAAGEAGASLLTVLTNWQAGLKK